MKYVYLLIDEDKNIVAIYDNETLASTMKKPLEDKFKKSLLIEKRSVNIDIKKIGVFK